jgi:hypothetical protein
MPPGVSRRAGIITAAVITKEAVGCPFIAKDLVGDMSRLLGLPR